MIEYKIDVGLSGFIPLVIIILRKKEGGIIGLRLQLPTSLFELGASPKGFDPTSRRDKSPQHGCCGKKPSHNRDVLLRTTINSLNLKGLTQKMAGVRVEFPLGRGPIFGH